MKTLICFGPDGKILQSENYELITCAHHEAVDVFLNRIEKEYAHEMKIVQVGFEGFREETFRQSIPLYPVARAHVFILRQYSLRHNAARTALNTAQSQKMKFTDTPSDLQIDFNTTAPLNWVPLEEESQFKSKVQLIRDFIAKGRLYQVNLTSALQTRTEIPAEELFNLYRPHFLGEYHALLPLPDVDVVCFSPELFLQKNSSTLTTRPIKGSSADTTQAVHEMLASTKENAELSMIVDLLRNDLQQAEPDQSAVVTKHRELMKLGYIQHTYSEVQIKTEKNLATILKATLPGGSISGCPKTESLQVVSETEKYKRQIYTGVIGWWQGSEFALNLAIRTFIKHGHNCYYHAGCGIVYDSDPENEWREFLLKAGKLQVTI